MAASRSGFSPYPAWRRGAAGTVERRLPHVGACCSSLVPGSEDANLDILRTQLRPHFLCPHPPRPTQLHPIYIRVQTLACPHRCLNPHTRSWFVQLLKSKDSTSITNFPSGELPLSEGELVSPVSWRRVSVSYFVGPVSFCFVNAVQHGRCKPVHSLTG